LEEIHCTIFPLTEVERGLSFPKPPQHRDLVPAAETLRITHPENALLELPPIAQIRVLMMDIIA
jgi:hypothetical protein